MKLKINKRALMDALRRTRGLRILATVLAVVLPVLSLYAMDAYGYGAVYGPVTASSIPMGIPVVGGLILLVFEDAVIHRYHRSRKWEFYWVLPVSRKERFDSTFLAQTINLIWYIVVSEASQIGGFALLMSWLRMDTEIYWGEHVRRLVMFLIVGLFFLTLISIIRELTHTLISYAVLLIGTVGLNYVIFSVLPVFVRAFSGNVVVVEGSFLYRFRIIYRLFRGYWRLAEVPQCVAYDWPVLLIVLLLAAGLFVFGRRLASGFRTECVEAEYRNRPLFGILLVLLGMFPFLLLIYGIVNKVVYLSSDLGEFTLCIVLSPIYLSLVIVLLCMLLHRKPNKKIVITAAVSPLAALLICGGAFLYAAAAKKLPAKEEIIAIRSDGESEGYIFTDRGVIADYYERIQKETEHPQWGLKDYSEVIVTVYTKHGSRQYAIEAPRLWFSIKNSELDEQAENTIIIPENPNAPIICGYGTKPRIYTDFPSDKEYEHFLSLIPEDEKKKVDCYYVNAFGGLSRSSESVWVCYGLTDPDREYDSSIEYVEVYARNAIFRESIELKPNVFKKSEAMKYYYETVLLPKKRKAVKATEKSCGTFESDGYYVTVYPRYRGARYYFTLQMKNGVPIVSAHPGVVFSEEESRSFYELVFSEQIDIHKDLTTVEVTMYPFAIDEADMSPASPDSFTQCIPTEQLAPYLAAVDAKQQEYEKALEERRKEREEGGQIE